MRNDKKILVVREDPNKHPVLNVLKNYVGDNNVIVLTGILSYLYALKKIMSAKEILTTDPIVSCSLIFKRQIFFSLEMFEYQVPIISFKSFLRWLIFITLHRISLKFCSKVIFPSKLRANYYLNRIGGLSNKISIVPNYPSESVLSSISNACMYHEDIHEWLKPYIIEGEREIENVKEFYLYMGTLNPTRGLDIVVKSVPQSKEVVLLLAGRLNNEEYKKGCLKNNVLYLGDLDRSVVMRLLTLVDYAFMYYSNDLLNTKLCSPVKIFEYINSGVSIISNVNEGLSEYKNTIKYFINSDGKIVINPSFDKKSYSSYLGISYEKALSDAGF